MTNIIRRAVMVKKSRWKMGKWGWTSSWHIAEAKKRSGPHIEYDLVITMDADEKTYCITRNSLNPDIRGYLKKNKFKEIQKDIFISPDSFAVLYRTSLR